MYARQIMSEETYTLAEAREIINNEMRLKRETVLWKVKQKIMGIALITISIAIPLLFQDASISILTLPLGIYLLLTRKKVIY